MYEARKAVVQVMQMLPPAADEVINNDAKIAFNKGLAALAKAEGRR